MEKKTTNNKQYLYNYFATFLYYAISAILYYVLEDDREGVLTMIAIFAICQSLEFWLVYLVYKNMFKNSKVMRLFKIFMVIALILAFFNFASLVKYSFHYFLIMAILVTIISLTMQNLILTKGKKV